MPNQTAAPNTVCIVGDFLHEGLSAKIAALGFEVAKLSVNTTDRHWCRVVEKMRALRAAGARTAIVVYLPTPTLLRVAKMSLGSHRDAVAALTQELASAASVVFVHEDNLMGNVEPPPWEYEGLTLSDLEQLPEEWQQMFRDHPEIIAELQAERARKNQREYRLPTRDEWLAEHAPVVERVSALIEDLVAEGVELVPFRTRHEVTTRVMETLDDLDAGVFLRLYVPTGRYQGDQLGEFLDLFARYFREVEGREFAIDTHSTRRGTTYVFRGRSEIGGVADVQDGIRRFDEFMAVAQLDPGRAEGMLVASGASAASASDLVARYSRAYRRLTLDMRHEWDKKRLALSQALETDLLDLTDVSALPGVTQVQPSALLSIVGNSGAVTIALSGNQFAIGPNANQLVGQLVNGDVTYNPQDKEIIGHIESLENKVEALALRSALDRLKDEATPADEKRTAAQRLKSFLIRSARVVGAKATDVATQVLIKYLESLVAGAGGAT